MMIEVHLKRGGKTVVDADTAVWESDEAGVLILRLRKDDKVVGEFYSVGIAGWSETSERDEAGLTEERAKELALRYNLDAGKLLTTAREIAAERAAKMPRRRGD